MADYSSLVARFKLNDPFQKNPAPATKLINNVSISTSDLQIDPSRTLWFRLYTPTTNPDTPLPLIVYFHGGGFHSFGPDTKTFDDLCTHLAAKVPAVIASINYRLTPQHKYPTQYDDGYAALKFIDAQSSAVLPPCTDLHNTFIAGDSAGGNLAHHVTFRVVNNARDFGRLRIAGLVAVQPFFGGEVRTESELRLPSVPMIDVKITDQTWRKFLPEGENRDHPAVNVPEDTKAAEEIKRLEFPRTLVIVGGIDPLQDRGRRYVDWLKSSGKEAELVEYPDAFHAFYAFPGQVPEFDLLLEAVTNFIHKNV